MSGDHGITGGEGRYRMNEMGVITVYRAAPRHSSAMTLAIQDLAYAILTEEVSAGGIRTAAFYRMPRSVSIWYSFMHFSLGGFQAHGRGEQVGVAQQRILALLCEPAHRQLLDPVIRWGCGERIAGALPRPSDSVPASDVGAVYSLVADPGDDALIERLMRRIFDKVSEHEVPTGDVLTYTLYRDFNRAGRWVMFEHFTAHGAAMHAAHPDVLAGGIACSELMVAPYERQVLEPLIVHGCGEAIKASAAETQMQAIP